MTAETFLEVKETSDLTIEKGGDFSGGEVDKNLSANAGDTGSIPGQGRFHMPCSNEARAPQLPKPLAPRACAPQQEKPPQ